MRIVYAFLTKSRQSAVAVISNNKGGRASLSISFYAAEIMIYNGRSDGARCNRGRPSFPGKSDNEHTFAVFRSLSTLWSRLVWPCESFGGCVQEV